MPKKSSGRVPKKKSSSRDVGEPLSLLVRHQRDVRRLRGKVKWEGDLAAARLEGFAGARHHSSR